MKILRNIAIAVVMLAGMGMTQAQTPSKVAHIDVQKLLGEMPEMKSAQAELKKIEQNYKADLESSYQELRAKMKRYGEEAETQTPEENKKRTQEVQGMEQNILKAEQAAGQELQKKQLELLKPLLEKAQQAIQKVAKAQGFNYVIDASQGGGLIFYDGGNDLMAEVKVELGF